MRTEDEKTNTIKWLRAWFWSLWAIIVGPIYVLNGSLDGNDWLHGENARLQQQVIEVSNIFGGAR